MGGRGPKVRSKGLELNLEHDIDGWRYAWCRHWSWDHKRIASSHQRISVPEAHRGISRPSPSSLIECQFRPRQWRLQQGSWPRWPGTGCPGWHVQHPAAASCPTQHFRSSWCRNSLNPWENRCGLWIMKLLRWFCQGGILWCVCVCVWASAVHGGWISL